MRAVVVDRFGGPEVARVVEFGEAAPAPGEVLVEVSAAAVNPVDLVTRDGLLHEAGLHGDPPLRLGWDVAGIVRAVGAGAVRLRVGDTVIGLSDRLAAPSKTHATHVVLPEDAAVGVTADGDDLARLSTLPLAGLTAWQALDRVDVRAGESLLVTGAAGRVGSIAARLGVLAGATVLGAGRPSQRAAIEATGARFVDAAHVAARVRTMSAGGAAAVIDAAGLCVAALDAVRAAGRYVGLVVADRPAPLRGITATSLAVRADWRQLAVLCHLVATGAVWLPDVVRYDLDDVMSAYDAADGPGSPRVVLVP